MLLVVLCSACLAPWLAPRNPEAMDVTHRLARPSLQAPLGTDNLGRDVLSRILYGGQISLVVGAATAAIATVAGIVLGLAGGFVPRLGEMIMRVVDGLMAFPSIILALAFVAVLGPRLGNTILALAIVYTPRVARVEHAAVLQIRTREYVHAAVGLGARTSRIVARHIFPNTIGPILVQSTFTFAYAVLAEAGLSFLGVGVPPSVPTWGNLIASGRDFILVAPLITIAPGVGIFMVVMALNLVGDGLRDLLDPRLRLYQPEGGLTSRRSAA
jgi:peptide/nickel transport system permease protein